jgi:acetyl-CoA carboxylase biotin carboxyl carrier protein
VHELDETRREEARQQSLPLEEVERLVDLVRESGVGEIRVRRGEVEITVKANPEAPVSGKASQAEARAAWEPAEIEPSSERDGLHAVRSPLVGTFYRAPAPGEEPYVEVGDRVRSGQALCIVEAMKLMNEIPADVSGEVVEILVENAEGVEYDQPLFRLRPEE